MNMIRNAVGIAIAATMPVNAVVSTARSETNAVRNAVGIGNRPVKAVPGRAVMARAATVKAATAKAGIRDVRTMAAAGRVTSVASTEAKADTAARDRVSVRSRMTAGAVNVSRAGASNKAAVVDGKVEAKAAAATKAIRVFRAIEAITDTEPEVSIEALSALEFTPVKESVGANIGAKVGTGRAVGLAAWAGRDNMGKVGAAAWAALTMASNNEASIADAGPAATSAQTIVFAKMSMNG
jgi:hypothetical protein